MAPSNMAPCTLCHIIWRHIMSPYYMVQSKMAPYIYGATYMAPCHVAPYIWRHIIWRHVYGAIYIWRHLFYGAAECPSPHVLRPRLALWGTFSFRRGSNIHFQGRRFGDSNFCSALTLEFNTRGLWRMIIALMALG